MKKLLFLISIGTISAFCPMSSEVRQLSTASDSDTQFKGQIPMANNISDPLVVLNHMFHANYDSAGDELIDDPLIVFEGDYIVLLRKKERVETEIQVPPIYHQLKMVSHIPLNLFTTLFPLTNGKGYNELVNIDPASLASLLNYSKQMSVMRPSLTLDRFDSNQVQYQRCLGIYDTSDQWLQDLFDQNTPQISLQLLTSFVRKLVPDLMANLDDAAGAQLENIHRIITDWTTSKISSEEFEGLQTFITNSHMARPDNIVSQYFERWLRVPINYNDKFLTTESVSDETTVYAQLRTHENDYASGTAFFQDEWRMHRDALSDSARKYLDKWFAPFDVDTGSTKDFSDVSLSHSSLACIVLGSILLGVMLTSILSSVWNRCRKRRNGDKGILDDSYALHSTVN